MRLLALLVPFLNVFVMPSPLRKVSSPIPQALCLDLAWGAQSTFWSVSALQMYNCSRGRRGVGYISWSDADGRGFTIWIDDEEIFRMTERALKAMNALRLA
jgi:hypothetical protein